MKYEVNIGRVFNENIEGFPTGNVYVGMTREEYDLLKLNLEKLDKYENIDEELGIEYPIFYKALHNGIWTRERWYIGSCLSLSNGNLGFYINELDRLFLFKDYGKEWALDREELL